MARKSLNQPRRLYTRKGATIVLFDNRYFVAPSRSAVKPTDLVTCAKVPSDGGRARVQVAFGEGVSEVWRSHKL